MPVSGRVVGDDRDGQGTGGVTPNLENAQSSVSTSGGLQQGSKNQAENHKGQGAEDVEQTFLPS